MGPKLRIVLFGLGILTLFGVLLRTLYLESAIIANAYEIRKLREEEAWLKNNNGVLRSDIAFRLNQSVLRAKAREMGMEENATVIPVSVGPIPKGN
ncbi:MAG: hypothetical protein V3W41_01210 [Planctomycetota bacterium]